MKLLPAITAIASLSALSVGGGYSYWQHLNRDVHVLVKKKGTATGASATTEPDKPIPPRDYHCFWSTSTSEGSEQSATTTKQELKENSCAIKSISFTTGKATSLKNGENTTEIDKFATLTTTSEAEPKPTISKDYFLITTKWNHLEKFEKQSNLQVSINSGFDFSTSDNNSNGQKFDILGYFDSSWKFTGQSDLILGKLTKVGNSSDAAGTKSYKCAFEEKDFADANSQECYVCKVSDKKELDTNEKVEDLATKATFQSAGTTTAFTADDEGHYYLIQLTDKTQKWDVPNQKEIFYVEETTGNSPTTKKIATFSIEKFYLGNVNGTTKELILLN